MRRRTFLAAGGGLAATIIGEANSVISDFRRKANSVVGHQRRVQNDEEIGVVVESPVELDSFPYVDEPTRDWGDGIAGPVIRVEVDKSRIDNETIQLELTVENPGLPMAELFGYQLSQLLVLFNPDHLEVAEEGLQSRVDGGEPMILSYANVVSSITGGIPETVRDFVTTLAREAGERAVTSHLEYDIPPAIERSGQAEMIHVDFSTDTVPAITSPRTIDSYELIVEFTTTDGTEESVVSIVPDLRGRTAAVFSDRDTPTGSVALPIEYRRQIDVQMAVSKGLERLNPTEEIAIQPGTEVLFEVSAESAAEFDFVEWHHEGDYVGDSIGPWQGWDYGYGDAYHARHTFESEGTHEVTAEADAADGDQTYSTSWTVHVTDDGNEAPAIADADPDFDDPVAPEPVDLELEAADPDGALDRVVWWLWPTDVLEAVVDVDGSEDAASLSVDGGDVGVDAVVTWVIDDDGALTEESWAIDHDLEEGGLEVTAMETNDPVEAGEVLEVVADLENTGDEPVTQEVNLLVGSDREHADSVTVDVDPGELEVVTLEYETFPVEQDVEFPVWVETDDDESERTVEVVVEDDAPEEYEVEFPSCTRVEITGSFEEGHQFIASQSGYVTSGVATWHEHGVTVGGGGENPEAPFTGTIVLEVTDGTSGVELVEEADDRLVYEIGPSEVHGTMITFVGPAPGGDSPFEDDRVENPNEDECHEEIRPERPDLTVADVEPDDGDALTVTFRYENDNDLPLTAFGEFVEGSTTDDPIDTLDPGTQEFSVTWTPETADERLVWEVDLEAFGYDDPARAETEPAGEYGVTGPGHVDVEILETNDPVEAGGTLEVVAQVENTGDGTVTQEVDLLVGSDREHADSATIDVGPDETETVTLVYETFPVEQDVEFPVFVVAGDTEAERTVEVHADGPSDDHGHLEVTIISAVDPVQGGEWFEVTVEVTNTGEGEVTQDVQFPVAVVTEDDEATHTVDVLGTGSGPGEGTGTLSVTITGTNAPVDAGAFLEVSTLVENTGDAEATQQIRLLVGGDQVDTHSVTVGPGGSQTATLGYETYPVQQDVEVTVTVQSDDDSDSQTVTVFGQ